jgi:hypothetical protein
MISKGCNDHHFGREKTKVDWMATESLDRLDHDEALCNAASATTTSW